MTLRPQPVGRLPIGGARGLVSIDKRCDVVCNGLPAVDPPQIGRSPA